MTGAQPALAAMRSACRSERPFTLALLDADMPDMDGCAVARQIKEKTEPAPAIIMMLSTRDRQRNSQRIREQGGASLLMKPIGQAELLEAIQKALGNSPPADNGNQCERRSSEDHLALRKWNVLVAEDNPVNQLLVARILQKRGQCG